MTKTSVFKFFWHDQDEEQEAWLRDMARQGLHLVNVGMLCRWTFNQGPEADVVYCVDYGNERRDRPQHDETGNRGWEYVADVSGWFYWRKPVIEGVPPQVSTKAVLKVAQHKRKLAILWLAIIPFVLMAMSGWNSRPVPFVLLGFMIVMMPLYAYIVARLIRRIVVTRRSIN
jgi:hypothetical protein